MTFFLDKKVQKWLFFLKKERLLFWMIGNFSRKIKIILPVIFKILFTFFFYFKFWCMKSPTFKVKFANCICKISSVLLGTFFNLSSKFDTGSVKEQTKFQSQIYLACLNGKFFKFLILTNSESCSWHFEKQPWIFEISW